jgi:DNA helicase HerA-like ATPase
LPEVRQRLTAPAQRREIQNFHDPEKPDFRRRGNPPKAPRSNFPPAAGALDHSRDSVSVGFRTAGDSRRLLAELFEELPEAGDLAKPKLVFFFDEAHLLFDDAPKALVDKVEQVVRLIRSKGVGVYFITQNPLDIPEDVLGQLGNRVQHALRAFTPRDQRAVRAAAETFRANPEFNAATAIQELAVGEALVSLLEDKGIPGVV